MPGPPQPPQPPQPPRPPQQGSAAGPATEKRQSPWAIFLVFLRLGLTSFGGPIAHIGYFRSEFVERRRWLDERSFADLVALCQFLPGPASSQAGFAIGLARGGWAGSIAAWLGFTLPSALLMTAFALGVAQHRDWAASGLLHGLKVVAVAVVAQAVWTMARSLCPDRARAALAVASALLTLLLPTAVAQLGAIVASGAIGWALLKLPGQQPQAHRGWGVSPRVGAASLALFFALLLGLPLAVAALASPALAMLEGFFRAGALVFGGGHVVLPLLQSAVVPGGAVTNAEFLAGYGAAQALPGPLFTFAAYLGAVMQPPAAWWSVPLGAALCVMAVFLPAVLLVVGALPFWDALRRRAALQSALAGVNAGVVGILLAALYDPVWTSAIRGAQDFALALAAFALLVIAKWSPLAVVALAAAGGWTMAALA
jgi:chromate transporter